MIEKIFSRELLRYLDFNKINNIFFVLIKNVNDIEYFSAVVR